MCAHSLVLFQAHKASLQTTVLLQSPICATASTKDPDDEAKEPDLLQLPISLQYQKAFVVGVYCCNFLLCLAVPQLVEWRALPSP